MLKFVRAAALSSGTDDFRGMCSAVYPSLFYIEKGSLITSGFFVSQTGVGVTVHHFWNQARGRMEDAKLHHNGKSYDFDVVHKSESKDVVVISVKAEANAGFRFLRLSQEKLQVGDVVVAFGTNAMLMRCFAPGYVLDPAYNLMKTVSFPCIRSSCRAEPGYSGGPVVLSSGQVASMHKAETRLFGGIKDSASIPSREIITVLEEVAVETSQGWVLK